MRETTHRGSQSLGPVDATAICVLIQTASSVLERVVILKVIRVLSGGEYQRSKHVRNEDSGRLDIFIVIFLEGRLFPDEGFVDDVLIYPGDKDRNTTDGAKDEQAEEWIERKRIKKLHTDIFVRLHTGLISVTTVQLCKI